MFQGLVPGLPEIFSSFGFSLSSFETAFGLLRGAKDFKFWRHFFLLMHISFNLCSNFPKRIRMSSFNVEALLHFFAAAMAITIISGFKSEKVFDEDLTFDLFERLEVI